MPTVVRRHGKGREIDGTALRIALMGFRDVEQVYMEQVGPMRKDGRTQGVTSAYHFGRATGRIEGVLDGFPWPVTYLTPQRWKKHHGLIGQPKQAAVELAREKYPGIPWTSGQADALLIALCGMA